MCSCFDTDINPIIHSLTQNVCLFIYLCLFVCLIGDAAGGSTAHRNPHTNQRRQLHLCFSSYSGTFSASNFSNKEKHKW